MSTPRKPTKTQTPPLEPGTLTITADEMAQRLLEQHSVPVVPPPPALPPEPGNPRRWPPEGGKRRILYLLYTIVVFIICFLIGYGIGSLSDKLGRRLFGATNS
jgi:hypothetical protein